MKQIFLATTLLLSLISPSAYSANNVLKIYGPGGPLEPMKECGELFSKKYNIKVEVIAGPEKKWLEQAKKDADLIFGGAEYMFTQFDLNNPDFIDKNSRTSLYQRPIGILVRKGNPKKIKEIKDLAKKGVNILDINGAGQVGAWEDLAGKYNLIEAIQKNIKVSVSNSAEGIEKLKSMPELDAWVTYESWFYRLKKDTDLVKFPQKDKIYRGTPISITNISDNKLEAQKFIIFLKSEIGHKVFKKWGWN